MRFETYPPAQVLSGLVQFRQMEQVCQQGRMLSVRAVEQGRRNGGFDQMKGTSVMLYCCVYTVGVLVDET